MSNERAFKEQLFERMADFAKLCSSGQGNNISLEGPIDVPTRFRTFIGLFTPTNPSQKIGIATVSQENWGALDLFEKVLKLELPNRLISTPIHDDQELRARSVSILKINRFPYIMLGIGQTLESNEEAIY